MIVFLSLISPISESLKRVSVHLEGNIGTGQKCLFGIGDPRSHINASFGCRFLLYLQYFCQKLKLVRSIGPGKLADFSLNSRKKSGCHAQD